MIVVISQAWTKPGEEHAEAYLALSEEFGRFWADHRGFRGRQLVRGVEDRSHFTHLRWFDSIAELRRVHARTGLRGPHRSHVRAPPAL